jgi:hypothetical protein
MDGERRKDRPSVTVRGAVGGDARLPRNQVIKMASEGDGLARKIEWVLSDGQHSFPASVEPDIADGVALYAIIMLESFKLVR